MPQASVAPVGGDGAVDAHLAGRRSPLGNSARIFVSPLAKRLARSAGIDPATIVGTGPEGRIVKKDVERHARTGHEARSPGMGAATLASALGSADIKEGAPCFSDLSKPLWLQLRAVVRVDDVLDALEQFSSAEENATDLSLADFLLRASSWALRQTALSRRTDVAIASPAR